MADKRRHKAYVVTDDETWIAFRALVMVRGATLEHALGRLVERVVASPAPMEARAVIGRVEGAQSVRAPASTDPAPKAKANVRSSNKRSSRPTRTRRS